MTSESDDRAFDGQGFVSALEVVRRERSSSWRDVAKAINVSPSTLTRLRQGAKPDVDTFFALCRWAGLPVEDFTTESASGRAQGPGSVSTISAALRADPKLNKDDVELLEELLTSAYQRMIRKAD